MSTCQVQSSLVGFTAVRDVRWGLKGMAGLAARWNMRLADAKICRYVALGWGLRVEGVAMLALLPASAAPWHQVCMHSINAMHAPHQLNAAMVSHELAWSEHGDALSSLQPPSCVHALHLCYGPAKGP